MLLRPPTDQELEYLSVISGAFFVLALLTIILVVSYSAYLMFKTKLPGRIAVFLGATMFAVFFIWSQYMGGNLEYIFGPVGRLFEVTAWSTSFALFLGGHFLMLKKFRKIEHGS